ncbi:hypothetical protein K504DRAFT_453818 [Pleomassaria siparia CBS 279.74]|uniref:Arrestin-like N-terminal domain-containing protein n=1 Tax=Pleomassaria siparia CBS 279.74 TaxID=1314801 RepID=A0A6G1KD34_9PLEO|nr:hypothetical protein K504DRAFT_453818 [Pleomassaria siparia CBS 279.74]
MAIPAQNQQPLATFPHPPRGLTPSPTPTRPTIGSPSPNPHPSKFGSIHGSIETEESSGSIYKNVNPFALTPDSVPTRDSLGLQLVLDSPSKLYAPGETVTGYITGWDYSSSPSTHIHIILEGRAKTYMHADGTEHQDCAPLLYEVTHLRSENQGVVPRFTVTIPEKCAAGLEYLNGYLPDSKMYWSHDWPAQDPFECSSGHPLPPSISLPLRTSHTLSSRIAGRGYVEYKLIAVRSTLDLDTAKLVPEASFQVPIQLTTRRLLQSQVQDLMSQTHNSTQNLKIQTTQLLKEKPLSTREQLKDAFLTTTPSFYFATTLTTPRLSIPGADVKIGISVAVLPPPVGKTYNFPIPDISITHVAVRVRSYHGVRVLRPPPSSHDPTRSYTFNNVQVQTETKAPSAIFTPQAGDFVGQTCVVSIALPETMTPSFKTRNLWTGYRLKCVVTFGVKGKYGTAVAHGDLNIVSRPGGQREGFAATEDRLLEHEDRLSSLDLAMEVVRRCAAD